jgi:hypothetical protein
VAGARDKLAEAIDADPGYADPYCYLAIIAAVHDDDPGEARAQAETCLDLDPPADLRAQVTDFLATLD